MPWQSGCSVGKETLHTYPILHSVPTKNVGTSFRMTRNFCPVILRELSPEGTSDRRICQRRGEQNKPPSDEDTKTVCDNLAKVWKGIYITFARFGPRQEVTKKVTRHPEQASVPLFECRSCGMPKGGTFYERVEGCREKKHHRRGAKAQRNKR